jgi:protein-S-isoprenylcysteine O-methyltransferase Ste14
MFPLNLLIFLLSANLTFYIIFTLFFDVRLISFRDRAVDSPKPSAWESDLVGFLTSTTSLLQWLLFVIIPVNYILNRSLILAELLLFDFEDLLFLSQLIGLILISIGSLIAFLGRLARGRDAIGWGIPKKLVTSGIFRYIRHPLYSSYCFYFIGFFLIVPSLFTMYLLTGIYGYYKTAQYEEKLLIEHFNDQYTDYMNIAGIFLPKLSK